MPSKSEIAAVLERESRRWSEAPVERLLAELRDPLAYEVVDATGRYQIEAQLLENTESYVHLLLIADDGSFRRSIFPAGKDIIIRK